MRGAEVVELDVVDVLARAPPRPLLVLAPRDRAGRVDERAAWAQGPAARRRIRRWSAARRSTSLGRLAPARVGPRGERAEVGAGRVHEDPVVARAESASVASATSTTVTLRAPERGAELGDLGGARAGRARPRRPRRGRPSARRSRSVLIPGPAQRSSTCSPGCGSSSSTTACEPRVCGHQLAGRRSRRGHRRRRRRVDDERLGRVEQPAGPGPADLDRRRLAARPRAAAGRARSVLTRSAVSAGSFIAAMQRAAPRRAELLPPHPRQPLGVRSGRPRRPPASSRPSARRAARRARAPRGAGPR